MLLNIVQFNFLFADKPDLIVVSKALEEEVAKRREYYQNLATQQMGAVDSNYMKEENPAMPMFKEKKTKVTFGRGGQ